LDIVAWHEQCLAFIEVRTRHGRTAGTPEESITPHKKQRLLNLVDAFLQAEPGLLALSGELPPCRIDVVAVEFEATGELSRLEVIENAIQAE
ncbi:MAG: YraN family protein, partial [Chloroflexota bacterium]